MEWPKLVLVLEGWCLRSSDVAVTAAATEVTTPAAVLRLLGDGLVSDEGDSLDPSCLELLVFVIREEGGGGLGL